MNIILRTLLSTVVFSAVHFFSYWMLFLQIVPEDAPQLAWSLSLISGCLGAAFTWCKLGHRPRGLVAGIACRTLTFGSFGLIAGFVGLLLLSPSADCATMTGIASLARSASLSTAKPFSLRGNCALSK